MKAVAFGVLLTWVTWLLYVAVMHLRSRYDDMPRASRVLAYPVLVVGVLCDVALNVAVGTLLFLDMPREFLLTARLKRYQSAPGTWRAKAARWVCKNLLNPFDDGGHC
jgi:hypothetical protein